VIIFARGEFTPAHRVELLRRMRFILVAALSVVVVLHTHAANVESGKTLYVQFILGTDKPWPQSACHEIGPRLSKKLSPVFRWKHFWEVDRKKLLIQPKKTTRVELAGDRKIEIAFTHGDEVEVRLYRRSGLITKTRHTIGGPMSILGGEEDTRDSFFIVVRGDEPATNE
jgi:hypothetical protein